MLKKIAAFTILTLVAGLAQAKTYGNDMPMGEAVDIAVAAQNIKNYAGKSEKFRGRITQVCQMKGCWLMIESNGQAARIQMKDDAFVIPKDSKGDALVFGEIERIEPSNELQITASSIAIQ